MSAEIKIQPLIQIDAADLKRVASGYTSDDKYVVEYRDSDLHTTFQLHFVRLDRSYIKAYDHFDDEMLERYTQILKEEYSFGAFDDNLLVGFLIGGLQLWNQSLWVWEFHVAKTHQRMGIGRRLMDAVAEKAKCAGLQTIVCETQNTNAPAIQVYRKLGFHMEGVDISYYSNRDYPNGEIAIFMKRRLG